MNGPQHFRQAEELLAYSDSPAARSVEGEAVQAIAQAQVHATLALVLAVADTRTVGPQERWGGHTVEMFARDEWARVQT